MWLEIGNLNTRVVNASQQEKDWLREYLSFERTEFRRGRRPRTEVERMFNLLTNSFPTGLLSLVEKAAKDPEKTGEPLGYTIQRVDNRKAPCVPDVNADLAWLRQDQRGAVDAVCRGVRGILWMPTGSGKTEVGVGLTRALPCRWGFLVHRTNLVEQAAERYELRTGLPAGRVLEGRWDIPAGTNFVCMGFDTLTAALKRNDPQLYTLLKSLEGIQVDECHTLAADTFWRIAMMCANAYYRVGLSGTPLARGDRRSILAIAALGSVLYRIRSEELIKQGILAKPTVRMTRVFQASDLPTWQGVYGACVVRSGVRNRVLVEQARRAAKPCFLFVKEVAHGKALKKMLERAGIKAEFVWGSYPTDWRKSMVKNLVRGQFDVLVCSVIFQEGIDVPELRSIVVGSGGKSVIAALQRLGRGMRVERDPAGNVIKNTFECYDILDEGNKWLVRHARARQAAYQGESFAVIVESPVVAIPSVVAK